ncbi:MAG: alginate lyase family protein [Armatimonadota bacterium]
MTHPMLYANQDTIKKAQYRVNNEDWAKKALSILREKANKLEEMQMPVFETKWWDEAKNKHWTEIYPEINHHTHFAIREPLLYCFDAAKVYALTGEDKYKELTLKVLRHYTKYDFFPEHPDVGLNWAVICIPAIRAFDLIYNDCSDIDREAILDFFTRAMIAIRKNDDWWIETNPGGYFNNHYAWHKYYIGTYGLFVSNDELVNWAIYSDQGFKDLIEYGTLDDGLWFESSINYHFTAVSGIVGFAKHLRYSKYNFDLWNHIFANGRSLRDLLEGPLYTLFPDKTIPNIGDTYGKRTHISNMGIYFWAYDVYLDTKFSWAVTSKKSDTIFPETVFIENLPDMLFQPPPMETRMWVEHGYTALRFQEGLEYWDGNGFCAFVSNDLNSVHSHFDKFNLMVYGRGKHLAIDVDAKAVSGHAFSAEIQRQLNIHTINHNTIMIDEMNNNIISRKLVIDAYINDNDIKMISIIDPRGDVYKGVLLYRSVAVLEDYVVDVFQVVTNTNHTIDYLYHTINHGKELSTGLDMSSHKFPEGNPWNWLREAKIGKSNDDLIITSNQDNLNVRLTVCGEKDTQVITYLSPADNAYKDEMFAGLIVRRKGKSTIFASVLEAEYGSLPNTKIRIEEPRYGSFKVIVDRDGKEKEILIRELK